MKKWKVVAITAVVTVMLTLIALTAIGFGLFRNYR
jgi:hypothetical protein